MYPELKSFIEALRADRCPLESVASKGPGWYMGTSSDDIKEVTGLDNYGQSLVVNAADNTNRAEADVRAALLEAAGL